MNQDLPKLLRAIAGGTLAKENKHNIIFNAAADEIDELWDIVNTSLKWICEG